LQSSRDKKFQEYDFGKDENQKRYGSDYPPEIDIGSFDTPVAMFVGQDDELATPALGQWTKKRI